MAEAGITIQDVCNTSNNGVVLSNHSNGTNQIKWQSAGQQTNLFSVNLPGGYFQGYPNDFSLTVPSQGWTPTLTINNPVSDKTITNYISQNGQNCNQVAATGGPSIVIQS